MFNPSMLTKELKHGKLEFFTCPSCTSILNVSLDEGHRAQWIVDEIKEAIENINRSN